MPYSARDLGAGSKCGFGGPIWYRARGVPGGPGSRKTPFADYQIAAIAAMNDLILVTANLRDFEPVQGLRLERWHETTPSPA